MTAVAPTPFVGLTPALASLRGSSTFAVPVGLPDAAAVAAFVNAADPQVQQLLDQVAQKSVGAGPDGGLFYPDGKSPCNCGPQADSLDALKTWDGDPAWCPRKDGPIAAPVIRFQIPCGEMPTLFWPDIFDAAKTLLRGYLAHPPPQDADPIVQAKWTTRVFELCTVMGTATNVNPKMFTAFLANPVGPNFTPRVQLSLRDDFTHAYDITGADMHRNARVWVVEPTPGQAVSQTDINKATGNVAALTPADQAAIATPTTRSLPPLPPAVAARWNFDAAPPGSSPDTWFGGRERVQTPDPNAPVQFANRWFDDALTPAFFKDAPLTDHFGVTGLTGGLPMMLPEWVCQNSRTAQWMRGDMQPFRPGWFIRDGVLAWPSDYLRGDPKTAIQQYRGDPNDTFAQLSALFTAMQGQPYKPGWIFYKEWYEGTNSAAAIAGIGRTLYQREQFGPGFVPGAWFYMSAAYRWGAWFANLDYATIVNSALYSYVSVYLPGIVSFYSRLGVTLATPAAVQQLQLQISQVFAAAAREQNSTIGTIAGAASTAAAALAGTGVGMVFGIVLAVLAQLTSIVTTGASDEAAANNSVPIYSPMIRVPVDPNCASDLSAGTNALAASVPAVAAPAANAMITAYVQSLQQMPELAQLRAPVITPETPGWVYAVGAAGLVALGLGAVLVWRGKQ